MSDIEAIYRAVVEGNAAGAKAGVTAALAAGVGAETVLKEGLIAAMGEVGRLFEANEYFVPEMLVSARAMQAGLNLLKPYLAEAGAPSAGRVAIGTVKGDLHDIGKNIFVALARNAGFAVTDLGIDVPPAKFVEQVQKDGADILGMSGIMTMSLDPMAKTVKLLQEAGLRDKVKVIIGGLPVDERWRQLVGADAASDDAYKGLKIIQAFMGVK